MKRLILILVALLASSTAASAQCVPYTRVTTGYDRCQSAIGLSYVPVLTTAKLPSGIPLANIGNGDTTATELSYVHGVTSSIQAQLAALQPLSANLTALAALNSTGYAIRTGTNTWATRALIAGAGITLTNPDGVAAGATIALTNTSITFSASAGLTLSGCAPVSLGGTCTINLGTELAGLSGLSANGFVARTAAGTYASRAIAGGTGITVTYGDGVAGAPSIALTSNSLTIAAGTGISVSGCSPVSLGGTCTPSIASTAVTAAGYPTSGQIPTFTVGADGRLTAAGSTTTLTSPAISGPTFSGTEGGTRTIGGTPTLGANLAAGGFKVTGLGSPTAASSDASTALYSEAQKTGSSFLLYGVGSAGANAFIGFLGQTPNATASNLDSYCLPAAGVLKAVGVLGYSPTSGSTVVTVYQSTDHGNTFSATTLATTVGSGGVANTATGSVAGAAGDCFVGKIGSAWTISAGHTIQMTVQYAPN